MGDVTKRDVWEQWVEAYVDTASPTPLFLTDETGVVETYSHGRDDRPILQRHPEMESLLATEGRKVVTDWEDDGETYEGIIYLMYTLDKQELIPRYIGKAGKYGHDGKSLSNNLKNIRRNRTKFARWGSGYDYHIGELSNAVLNHHADEQCNTDSSAPEKYQEWATELFVEDTKTLCEPVYFWARAWRADDTGPFYDFETKLEALEYYLISLAGSLYPKRLLNTEGR